MSVTVSLDSDGVFRGRLGDTEFHLVFSSGCPEEPWRLLATGPDGGCAPVGGHVRLDDGLSDLAVRCGAIVSAGDSFSASLPCGKRFSRPGRLTAEEVMFNLGYEMIGTVTTFASMETMPAATAAKARMAAVERLGAHSDRLGNLALVEQDAAASVWCIDVAFLVDRYIHRDAFGDLPRRLLMGTVLDIHPDAEIEVRTMTDSEPAAILAYPVRGTMSG